MTFGKGILVEAMRQKAVGAEGPEMLVELAATLVIDALDDDAPVAFEAPLEERGQRILAPGFRQIVEQDFH